MNPTRQAVWTEVALCALLALLESTNVLAQQASTPTQSSVAAAPSTSSAAPARTPQAVSGPETYATVFDAEFTRATESLNHDALAKTATLSVNQTTKAVTATNAATTAPDGFATRIHSSFQDYLNLLAFAINKVDESKDGQSLIIRLNALRSGPSLLAGTLTLSKPGSISQSSTQRLPRTGPAFRTLWQKSYRI